MKRLFAAILAVLLLCGCSASQINGIIQWGEGGGTDTLMRPLCLLTEPYLERSVPVRNMPGGTGTVATQYVYDKPADGMTLLLGAENPAMYDALELSDLTYLDFDCVLLVGFETVGVTVAADSPYTDFASLIEAAKRNPGTIRLATTAKGGLPWTVSRFIYAVTGATFAEIPYDSDATARNAVLNGECEVTVSKLQSGVEACREGKMRFLCMFSDTSCDAFPDVPPITEYDPAFSEYLPWGPFYGVFVKKGTDPSVRQTLSDAFLKGYSEASYQTLLNYLYVEPLGLCGTEANEYIETWRAASLKALKIE